MQSEPIYHICARTDWDDACRKGLYDCPDSLASEGFIHFSTAAQIRESAARHHAGRAGLVLLAVDPGALGDALEWEESRGGALFPHLYGPLPVDAVLRSVGLPLGPDGAHVFPDLP